MAKLQLLITIDYELFGDGSGDIGNCMIKPTYDLLKIANYFNIPITLMVDVGELKAFKKEKQTNKIIQDYYHLIKKQLKYAILNGHDIQFHFHPQWLNYKYIPTKNKWEVNNKIWRISQLDYKVILNELKKGKLYLEKLFKKVKKDYKCFVFRAGSLSIQPAEKILKVIEDLNFLIDTSCVPNMYKKNELIYYDYRNTPKKLFWKVKKFINKENKKGDVFEFPIATRKYNFLQKIYYKLLRILRKTQKDPEGCSRLNDKKCLDSKIPNFKNLFFSSYYKLDVCNMSPEEIMNFLKFKRKEYIEFKKIPLITIGHSKTFNKSRNFLLFIKKAIKEGIEFITFKEALNL
jgi:hypothetical protein